MPSRIIRTTVARRSPTAPRRGSTLETCLAQLDGALDHTRPDRVRALAYEPDSDLVKRLGPAPSSPAGRAVWCHHALAIEAVLDRTDSATLVSTHSQHTARAQQEITLADRCLDTSDRLNRSGRMGQARASRPPPCATRCTATSSYRPRSTGGSPKRNRPSATPGSITLPSHEAQR